MMMRTSEIPDMTESISSLLKQVRKESRSVKNRLQSISFDSKWVLQVQEAYGNRPLVPNERCGVWYVPPELTSETSYFKSTDGHTNQWSFSTRRLNFHLFKLLVENDGLIVVDSTRRGKTMPDSFSKTIPIWCAVLNYIMFGPDRNDNWFFYPSQIISKNEANSIIKLIPQFAQTVQELDLVSKDFLVENFKGKYLRPIWIYPGLSLPFESPHSEKFIPLINCVSSFRADDGTRQFPGFSYVQGAADDHELWAKSLSPQLFWENVDTLCNVNLSDEELLQIIDKLKPNHQNPGKSITDPVKLTDDLRISKVISDLRYSEAEQYSSDLIIMFSSEYSIINDKKNITTTMKTYPLSCNKKGSKDLRKFLPQIATDIKKFKRVLVVCETGSDLSIGIAILILCTCYDSSWQRTANPPIVSKNLIKRHIAKILQFKKVNPSRATLQSINAFLM